MLKHIIQVERYEEPWIGRMFVSDGFVLSANDQQPSGGPMSTFLLSVGHVQGGCWLDRDQEGPIRLNDFVRSSGVSTHRPCRRVRGLLRILELLTRRITTDQGLDPIGAGRRPGPFGGGLFMV